MRSLLLLALLAFAATGCKDHNDHGDDHAEVFAFDLLVNNVVVASQTGTTVTGSIGVGVGSSAVVTVRLKDDTGSEITEWEDEVTLEVVSADAATVSVTEISTAQRSFRLTGAAEGSTTITLMLMHGGHADFESRPIVVSSTRPL